MARHFFAMRMGSRRCWKEVGTQTCTRSLLNRLHVVLEARGPYGACSGAAPPAYELLRECRSNAPYCAACLGCLARLARAQQLTLGKCV